MTVRSMLVFVEVDTDVAQDDEFEAMMAEVEMVVQVFSDPAIKRVKVVEYCGPGAMVGPW